MAKVRVVLIGYLRHPAKTVTKATREFPDRRALRAGVLGWHKLCLMYFLFDMSHRPEYLFFVYEEIKSNKSNSNIFVCVFSTYLLLCI